MLNIVSTGDLSKNCINLIDSLKTLISGISSRVAQLAITAEKKSYIEQVATATTEMYSKLQRVTKSAEDTLNMLTLKQKMAKEFQKKIKVLF